MTDALPHVELFTDGACSGNPGPGGWAFILRHGKSRTEKEQTGGHPRTTNNRMELMSVIEGLKSLERPCQVDLYSDSQYVVKGLREWLDQWKGRGWRTASKKPVMNVDLWKQLDDLRHKHKVTYHWVRGHDNHPENERCDRLAVKAIDEHRHDPLPKGEGRGDDSGLIDADDVS
jgi:ribonuclease HI